MILGSQDALSGSKCFFVHALNAKKSTGDRRYFFLAASLRCLAQRAFCALLISFLAAADIFRLRRTFAGGVSDIEPAATPICPPRRREGNAFRIRSISACSFSISASAPIAAKR